MTSISTEAEKFHGLYIKLNRVIHTEDVFAEGGICRSLSSFKMSS